MFRKVLSKLFGQKRTAPRIAPATGQSAAGSAPAPARKDEKKTTDARSRWEAAGPAVINAAASPEDLCGVTAAMSKEEIQERLAMLYRRHNRAASSLDTKLRDEAEVMLEAIAVLREKHFGRGGRG